MKILGNRVRVTLAGASLALSALAGAAASAETLNITETVSASGSIGGVSFTDQLISLTATGEGTPVNIRPVSNPHKDWRLSLSSLSLTIGSIYSGYLDPTSFYIFINDSDNSGGIGKGFNDFLDLTASPFATYDLSTDLTTTGQLVNYGQTVSTSAGNFTVTGPGSGSGIVNFSATMVPEPASWAMMTIGMGLIGAILRRKRVRVAFG